MKCSTQVGSFKPTSPKTTSPGPRVIVKVFNAAGEGWKDSSLSWLHEMRGRHFVLMEGHTLEILGEYRRESFIILVVRKTPLHPVLLMEPLPPKVYVAHYELGAWSGHGVFVDCSVSPPETTITRNLWEMLDGRGIAPHFERWVQPIIDELVARFEGES